jgi:hypothetical protein
MIPGLSAAVHRQLQNFELARGLRLGEVAGAYLRYRRFALRGRPYDSHSWTPTPDYDWQSDLHNARTLLELAMRSLNPRARCQFRTVIEPLDAAYQAWSLNDPFGPPHLPWWLRRIDGID